MEVVDRSLLVVKADSLQDPANSLRYSPSHGFGTTDRHSAIVVVLVELCSDGQPVSQGSPSLSYEGGDWGEGE